MNSPMDQNSVDALLNKVQADANALAGAAAPGDAAAVQNAASAIAEVAGEAIAGATAKTDAVESAEAAAVSSAEAEAAAPVVAAPKEVHRLLEIEVPVIVRLGMRRMTVGEVMRLAAGAIIEFGKSAEEELDLLANNKIIGKGHAVKVGENFGIKITGIGTVKETIRKLGAA